MQTHTDEFGREITHIGKYRYRLSNRHVSSDSLGPCSICHKRCTEVWYQVTEREFQPGRFTQHGCDGGLFGHRDCLISQRIGG